MPLTRPHLGCLPFYSNWPNPISTSWFHSINIMWNHFDEPLGCPGVWILQKISWQRYEWKWTFSTCIYPKSMIHKFSLCNLKPKGTHSSICLETKVLFCMGFWKTFMGYFTFHNKVIFTLKWWDCKRIISP